MGWGGTIHFTTPHPSDHSPHALSGAAKACSFRLWWMFVTDTVVVEWGTGDFRHGQCGYIDGGGGGGSFVMDSVVVVVRVGSGRVGVSSRTHCGCSGGGRERGTFVMERSRVVGEGGGRTFVTEHSRVAEGGRGTFVMERSRVVEGGGNFCHGTHYSSGGGGGGGREQENYRFCDTRPELLEPACIICCCKVVLFARMVDLNSSRNTVG